jgi:hypothetical protein
MSDASVNGSMTAGHERVDGKKIRIAAKRSKVRG